MSYIRLWLVASRAESNTRTTGIFSPLLYQTELQRQIGDRERARTVDL